MLESLSNWLDRYIGTLVRLPERAIEIELPVQMLMSENAGGLCVSKKRINDVIVRMLAQYKKKRINSSITKALKKIAGAPDHVTHVVIVSNDQVHSYGIRKHAVLKRALRNHERLHAMTMCYSAHWHVLIEQVLWSLDPDKWDILACELLKIDIYEKKAKELDYEPACVETIIATEIMARMAAISHAPAKMREAVAKSELPGAKDELLSMTKDVVDRWGGIEHLIGWAHALKGY